MLAQLIREMLMEDVDADTQEVTRLWKEVQAYVSDPKRLMHDIWLSPDEGRHEIHIQGSNIDPSLDDVYFALTPEPSGKARFLDIDTDETGGTHSQKELRLDLPGDRFDKDWLRTTKVWDAYRQGDDRRIDQGTLAQAIARVFKRRQGRPTANFSHEVLHLIQARKMGTQTTQKLFMGPEHPTTQRRLKRRVQGLHDKASGTSKDQKGQTVDRAFSVKGTESYASLESELMTARQLLDQAGNDARTQFPRPDAFIQRVLGGSRGRGHQRDSLEQLAQKYDPLTWRRITKMLTKMWNAAAGSAPG